jgi:hypothetical protein
MPIIVQCPSCERKLRVPDELLGKKVKCPGCKVIFTGEAESPAPPPPPPPPASRERQRPEPPQPPTPPPPAIRERQRPEAPPEPPAPQPPPPATHDRQRPEPPIPQPTPSPPGGMAALENLGLEDDEPAPPPPPAKKPDSPKPPPKKPDSPKPPAKKLENLKLELDDKPAPPPPPVEEDLEEISPEPMKPRPVKAKPIKARAIDDGKEPCPYCGELIKQGATRCKHCGEDLDEEDDAFEDDRPSRRGKKKRSIRREAAPHRGGMVMTLGIVSVSLLAVDVFCSCCGGALGLMISTGISAAGLGLGIPAWIMGQKDLAKMRNGDMDDRGRGTTQTGWICGLIGTILHGLGVVCGGVMLVFVVAMNGVSLMSTNSGFGGTPSNTPGRKFEVPRNVPRLDEDPPERIVPGSAPALP